MCGIVGYYSWTGRPLPEGRIQAMTAILAHRGPDDLGILEQGGIALGHTRLSIIDLSEAGHQPMDNGDGTAWITYNGEVYNFEALRGDLENKGYRFRSLTDTEVVLHQYDEDGTNCLEKLNGMFAFAIWDSTKRRLFLARDRAGEKPLFYYVGSDFIVFGSEIKALMASGMIVPDIDPAALRVCMVYNAMAAPATIINGIKQLLPGHSLICDEGPPEINRYWDLRDSILNQPLALKRDEEWLEGFASHLDRAVRMRMRSDAPYGAFLSGGIDSSAIVKIMSEAKSDSVKTFAFGFREEDFDESGYASEVAKIFSTEHEDMYTSVSELPTLVEKVVYHGEEYTPNPCFIPVYLLCRGASKKVKMVLSGDGGDELLAGYETHQASILARYYKAIPYPLRKGFAAAINKLPVSDGKVPLETKLKRFVYGVEQPGRYPHVMWRYIFTPESLSSVLTPSYMETDPGFDPSRPYKDSLDEAESLSFLNALLYADFSYYMPNDALVKLDRMGMAHGLEIRSPFLDHHLVEFSFQMPENLKLRRFFNKKHGLKKYLEGHLPRRLIQRRKAGFNVPVDQWLRRDLKEFLGDTLSRHRLQSLGIFNPKTIERLMDRHMDGRGNHGLELWNVLCLTIWCGLFAKTPANAVPPGALSPA